MKIALDVDDVIAGFYKAACEKCKVDFNGRVNHWEQPFITENWDAIAEDTVFWRNLELMNIPDFYFDYYLTSVPEHIIEHRQFWIDRNVLPNRPLLVSYDKVAMADKYNIDVLIDDKPANVEAWIKSGRHAIQYFPHNFDMPLKSPYYTKDFSKLKTILKEIKEKHYGKQVKGVQSGQAQRES